MSAARGWGLYGAAWAVASLLWTAAATSVGMRALDALPYGLLVMGVAAGLGVGVWHLSGRLDDSGGRSGPATWIRRRGAARPS